MYGKKLILVKPGVDEINHHLKQYDGIIAALKKYNKNGNVQADLLGNSSSRVVFDI